MKCLEHESFLLWISPPSPHLIPYLPQALAREERREVNGLLEDQQAAAKVIFSRLLKKGQMQGSRNPEE